MTPPTTSALERAPLASCPWCEGEAVFLNDGDPEYPIRILDSHVEPCPLGFHTLQISYRNEADAAEAWNRRPLEDALACRAEADEKALSGLVATIDPILADLGQVGHDGWTQGYAHTTDLDRLNQALGEARALLTPIAEGR